MIVDHPHTIPKKNSKCVKNLKVTQETIKILEENTVRKFFNLSHNKFLLDMSLVAKETKAQMNHWDFIKIKRFCTAKEAVNKTKRQPMEREKIFANVLSDKGLVFKIYKALIKLNTQRTNNPVKKWAEDMNSHFSKEDIPMANRHMKKCSTSLSIRETQIKTMMRYPLTPVRIAKINNTGNNRCWQGCKKRGTLSHTVGGNADWYSHSGKQYGRSSPVENRATL